MVMAFVNDSGTTGRGFYFCGQHYILSGSRDPDFINQLFISLKHKELMVSSDDPLMTIVCHFSACQNCPNCSAPQHKIFAGPKSRELLIFHLLNS